MPVETKPEPVAATDRRSRTAALLQRAVSATGSERDELLEQVIVLNIPVARSLAARYRNRGQSRDELEQVACLALTRAVQSFDPQRGDDLLVFAVPSILGEIKRHFRAMTWVVRPPRRLQELRPRLAWAEEELGQQLGRPPGIDELAAALDCTAAEVREARGAGDLLHATSLDEPLATSGATLSDLLPATEPGFAHSEAVAILGPACRLLAARDRRILWLRFYEQLTQRQIAEELGVTQVQVSRLLQRIFEDLRRAIGVEGPGAHAA